MNENAQVPHLQLDNSLKLYEKAIQIIAGGSQTSSKRPDGYAPGAFPIYLDRGDGCRVLDVDGNEYIDYIMALGPINLGYSYPRVNDAVREQLEKASIVSLLSPLEVELAEEIIDAVPCAEMVRFMKSGAEATSACVRIARAYTGREKVVNCGYHGWHDTFTASSASQKGVPKALGGLIRSFRYNDLESLRGILREDGDEVACIIMEPRTPPVDGFLEGVRELADQYDLVLIFDEIVTGFRVALGGAQEYYGVTPDLAAFAKGISNGLPLSAFVGTKEIMETAKDLVISTTYGGEALSLAAGLATVRELREKNVFQHTWEMGQKLVDGWREIGRELELNLDASGLAPIHAPQMDMGTPELTRDAWTFLLQEAAKRQVLLRRGGLNFISYSHKEEDIDYTLDVCRSVMKLMKEALQKGDIASRLETRDIKPSFRRY
ncbi:aspartate aminotransferase family protein [Candidatus Poribacteria bacterium]